MLKRRGGRKFFPLKKEKIYEKVKESSHSAHPTPLAVWQVRTANDFNQFHLRHWIQMDHLSPGATLRRKLGHLPFFSPLYPAPL